jgi:hypothetical protein
MIIFASKWDWNLETTDDNATCSRCDNNAIFISHYITYNNGKILFCLSCFKQVLTSWDCDNDERYSEDDMQEYEKVFTTLKDYIREHPELGLE